MSARSVIAMTAAQAAMDAQGYHGKQFALVGSAFICDRQDSDVDVLVLSTTSPEEATFPGWEYGGSGQHAHIGDNEDKFGSWKRTVDGIEVNLLLVADEVYFRRWLDAAEVCRFLHLKGVLLQRGLVHGVHEIIMDDSTAELEIGRRDYE